MEALQASISSQIRSSRFRPAEGTSRTQCGSHPRAVSPAIKEKKRGRYFKSNGTLRKTVRLSGEREDLTEQGEERIRLTQIFFVFAS